MATPYTTTCLQNANPVQIMSCVNTASNSLYGGLLMALIYIILFLSVDQEYFPNVLLGASFVMSIISGILLFMNVIGWSLVGMNIVLFVVAIFMKVWGSDR